MNDTRKKVRKVIKEKQFPIFTTNINENYEGITTMYGYADKGEITECINCSNKVWVDEWRNQEGYPCDLCGLPNNMNMEDVNKMKLAYEEGIAVPSNQVGQALSKGKKLK
tara:strand:- start:238 stop:567 length:330 start_codon:yes stop_codon:yes gene_type:complete